MIKPLIPLLLPNPARLSNLLPELIEIENSGIFSNYGPVNTRFEQNLIKEMFGDTGHCVTMCNATTALMLAIVQAVSQRGTGRRYALMPSFTFAATAHAALWAGLTPLLCDIDPETWLPCERSEQSLLDRHGDDVAALVPCATFGNTIDLGRYRALSDRYGCALVVDAAASLGSTEPSGRQFGTDAPEAIVFSMHATKAFATLEGAVVYSSDADRIAALRRMGNFGFEERSAVLPGMNAKLDEVTALLALSKLESFPAVAAHRYQRQCDYVERLRDFDTQYMLGARNAPTLFSALIPRESRRSRDAVRAAMLGQGVQTGAYFAPHVARQPYFESRCVWDDLPVSDDVADRTIALPMHDRLTLEDVMRVTTAFRAACLG